MPSFCDTGAIVAGDGCSDACTVECGFACSGGTATSPDSCSTICGDGLLAVENFLISCVARVPSIPCDFLLSVVLRLSA
jgi:hypothetical protein